MTPGTITRTADGRYEVHTLTSSKTVDDPKLAELLAAEVRRKLEMPDARHTQTARDGIPSGVRRKKRRDGA